MTPDDAQPGQVIQCQGGQWYDMVGYTGRLYRVVKVDTHQDGTRSIWVAPWVRDSRRRLKSGRTEGQPAGFSETISQPIGDGADYEPYPCPPDYAGQALPTLRPVQQTEDSEMTRGIKLKEAVEESTGLSGPNDADYRPGQVYDIPLTDISPDPHQPRVQFAGIEELAEGIRREGFRGAISFRSAEPADGVTTPLVIVDGERRYRACRHLELATIPALLDPSAANGPELRYRQATANDLAEPLTQWDWACMIKQLHEEHSLSHTQIARDLAERGLKKWDRSTVSNLYRLHQLPEAAQALVKSGWLSAGAGKYVVAIKSTEGQERVIARLVAASNSARRPMTVAEVQTEIYHDYRNHTIALDSQWLSMPDSITRRYGNRLFDYKTECKECALKHSILAPWSGKTEHFCVNPECHAAKQQAARDFLSSPEGREQEAVKEEAERQKREAIADRRAERMDAERVLDERRREVLVDYLRDGGASHAASIIAWLAYQYFLPWDQRQDAPSLHQIDSQLQLDYVGTLHKIAATAIQYQAGEHDLPQIAELLLVDLEAVSVSQETEAA